MGKMLNYDKEALERGIESAKKNIKTFEDAIEKERATIAHYYEIIEIIIKKQRTQNVD